MPPDRLAGPAQQSADPLERWRGDPRTVDLLEEIEQATVDAADLLSRTDERRFLVDRVLQRAATAILIQVGEATHELHPDFKALHPSVDWRAAYGMRNKLAHHYVDVDPQLLWDTMTTDIPAVAQALDPTSW